MTKTLFRISVIRHSNFDIWIYSYAIKISRSHALRGDVLVFVIELSLAIIARIRLVMRPPT